MKILIISECTPRERIIVYEVLNNFRDVSVIAPSGKVSVSNDVKSKKGKASFSQRIFKKLHQNALNKKIKGYNLDEIPHETILVPFSQLNNPESIQLIQNLKPDILLTCRAPMLSKDLLSIPKIGAINIHYGVPPKYRGNDTLFWAFLKKDFDFIGASVHQINTGVDRGDIYAVGYPSLQAKDDEVTIDIKTSLVISRAVVEVLKRVKQEQQMPKGMKQETLGKNYKKSDRSLSANLSYQFKKNLGLLKPIPREERIEYFI
ncbi:formyl transferase [Mongoliitalea daihaiensis]|uniref:formyl transferase n=1 Tax=Mongoliitalea daihaiensis TaxID=2782006 RepID=UPI001F20CBE5|nr:formyl transferase [Mongoliitalea daihaiensis]UJP66894.1 hypothetical protein IPZ59_10025 [Mongoliitalea daihaiensis]